MSLNYPCIKVLQVDIHEFHINYNFLTSEVHRFQKLVAGCILPTTEPCKNVY